MIVFEGITDTLAVLSTGCVTLARAGSTASALAADVAAIVPASRPSVRRG